MTLKEKQDLVRLLNKYQSELMQMNDENIEESERQTQRGEGEYHYGVKAQFEHARLIAAKMSVEIGRELASSWCFA